MPKLIAICKSFCFMFMWKLLGLNFWEVWILRKYHFRTTFSYENDIFVWYYFRKKMYFLMKTYFLMNSIFIRKWYFRMILFSHSRMLTFWHKHHSHDFSFSHEFHFRTVSIFALCFLSILSKCFCNISFDQNRLSFNCFNHVWHVFDFSWL